MVQIYSRVRSLDRSVRWQGIRRGEAEVVVRSKVPRIGSNRDGISGAESTLEAEETPTRKFNLSASTKEPIKRITTLHPSPMFASTGRRCLRTAASSAVNARSIPSSVLPIAQFHPTSTRSFASTPQCASKIGSQPLSVPPEVTFQVTEPSSIPSGGRISRTQPMSTVHMKGPMGKEIPSRRRARARRVADR
jgi:hypothetical protein